VALAYTLPFDLVQKARLQSLKIYLNVANAGIYQPHWTFWDAEYRGVSSNGGENTTVIPPPRYFSLGINITL
jgi:hypothetical protein